MQPEQWLDVIGYEGLYRVSTHGRVLSCARTVPDRRTGTRTKKERLLRLTVDSAGYQKVTLYRGEAKEVWKVHRLVATHFCAKPDGADVVNHIDNVTTHNSKENLEWTTPLGNNQHMCQQGRQRACRGEASGSSKITEADVQLIRELAKQGLSQQQIGERFGIGQAQVWRILRGLRWAHV